MSRPAASVRLFVAVYPPENVARKLLDLLPALGLPEYSPTPVHQMHLTMMFLGDRRTSHLDSIRESVAASCRGLRACFLTVERLVALPESGPKRLIAAETDSPPSLDELHRRLVSRLAHRGRTDPDRFLPHLTLCRFRGSGVEFTLEERADRVRELRLEVSRVCLVRSVLHPLGARHQQVAEWYLA
jgi:2'-5' RNA ligase